MAKKAKWKYDLPTEGIIPLWTDEPPTEPGLYWWYIPGLSAQRIKFCRVMKNSDGDLIIDVIMGQPLKVKDSSRVWAGPLLEPEE